MKKRRKEILLGITAFITVVAFIYGIYFLKGIDLTKSRRYFYAIYDRLHGLTVDNPVVVKGVPVGKVVDIALTQDTPQKVIVTFVVQDKNVRIYEDATAVIVSTDILGTRAIEIRPGTGGKQLKSGDTLASAIESQMTEIIAEQLKPLKARTEQLLAGLDSVVKTLQALLGKPQQEQLTTSIKYFKESMLYTRNAIRQIDSSMPSLTADIRSTTHNLRTLTATLRKSADDLNTLIKNAARISDSLSAIRWQEIAANLNATLTELHSLLYNLQHGKGTARLLLTDSSLYFKLVQSASSLDSLLRDLRLNPERYVSFALISIGGSGKRDREKNKNEKTR